MSNCFCGILAVYSFGPGQGKGIAEKSIFKHFETWGKKGELKGSQRLELDLI